MRLTDLAGRRVVVWGTGREGVAAVRAIAPVGPASLVAIEDVRTFSAHTWTDDLAALAPLRTGEDAHAALAQADVLVRSPGIRQTHPWVREARERGVQVTGGTALWMADHAARTIAVTGSKGKSTTSMLVSHLLAAAGRPNVFGGNIGVAALSLPDADEYVLELSVYQCADLTDSPRVAALTSLFPEHLDWSGGEHEYYRDKLTVVGPRPGSGGVPGRRRSAHLAARRPGAAPRRDRDGRLVPRPRRCWCVSARAAVSPVGAVASRAAQRKQPVRGAGRTPGGRGRLCRLPRGPGRRARHGHGARIPA